MRRLLAVVLAAAACACSADPPANTAVAEETARATEAEAPPLEGDAIEAIPHPELAELEERVRQQLDGARAGLEEKLSAEGLGETDRALAYGEMGMLYQAYLLRDAAGACYRNASRLAAESYDWPYLLGHVYEGLGDLDRAASSLRRALELRPDDLPAMLRLALVELERNRAEQAESLYRRALELDANSAAALLGLGKIANARREFESAVEHLERARELTPHATEINYPLGLAYRGLGQTELAVEWLEQRGEVPPPVEDPLMTTVLALTEGMRVHQLYGAFYFEQGRYRDALNEFRQAVADAPDEPLVRTNLALTLLRLGDPEGARREFEEALRLKPDDAFAHYNLGTLLADEGDDERAVGHFRATVESDPNQYRAHLNLANALRRLGRADEAVPHYRRVVENDPSNGGARLSEALTLVYLGRYAEARRRLEESHTALPEEDSIRQALVRVLAAAPDDDVRDGRRALALGRGLMVPEMPLDRVVTVAMVAAENGMYGEAAQLQSQAIEAMRQAGREELIPDLEKNLALYRSGRPCRTPWAKDDPALTPRRRKPDAGVGTTSALRGSMIEMLQQVARQADPQSNPFLNERRIDMLDRRIAAADEPSARDSLLFERAWEMLRAGRTEQSIDAVSAIIERFRAGGVGEGTADMKRLRELLAVGYLRLGEQSNCIGHHTADSCLLPIEGSGVHADPLGSRRAAEQLTALLRVDPGNLSHRWLLNLAHMTLGQYPAEVPREWLIPPEAFHSDSPLERFRDVAPALGLDTVGLAGGAAMEDFDGDGRLDLVMSSWGLTDQLRYFRNDGDGGFSERTEQAGLSGQLGGLNLNHADYDNDGDADLFVLRGAWLSSQGHHPNSLLRNDGDGTFTDVTRDAGVLTFRPTQAAAWTDFDLDGRLDLFVGNESAPGDPNPCELYRNNGDGTFTDVADTAGLEVLGFVKSAAWGDYDDDGWPDLYLSRYLQPNLLLRNEPGPRGSRRFVDVTGAAGVAEPELSFPAWFWDFDNDGDQDLMVASFADFFSDSLQQVVANYLDRPGGEHSRLYRNDGGGRFTDVTVASGLDDTLLAMGANFGDLDNDGFLDAYFGTGLPRMNTLVPNKMYRNDGGGRFLDVTTAGGFGHLQKGHGIAFGDVDDDGDQDLYAVMGGAFSGDSYQNALFLNPGGPNRWVTLRLVGTTSNRSAIGARIRVTVDGSGGRRDVLVTVGTGGSFGSSSLQQEIGLGDAESIHSVEITWPTNPPKHQRLDSIPLDSVVEIREDSAPRVVKKGR